MSSPATSAAAAPGASAQLLAEHAGDELLRMPVLWDRLVDAVLQDAAHPAAAASLAGRAMHDEVRRLLRAHCRPMGDAYFSSLHMAVELRLMAAAPAPANVPPADARAAARPRARVQLELVSDEVIALDVELSHTVQAIKEAAEQDLTDLQGYLAAMVGDYFVSEDHNPLPPAAHAQALRAVAQALPGSLAQRLAFIRAATPRLAVLLQQTYAAACERLAAQGLERAEHRSVITQHDHRWRFMPAPVTMPDLLGMRDAMPRGAHAIAVLGPGGGAAGGRPGGAAGGSAAASPGGARAAAAAAWAEELRSCGSVDLQSVELVSRLFKAIGEDERVPADVGVLLARLREPAMRLALRDPSLLDRLEHPLWRWIHLFAYQAEMLPHVHDAERRRWLEFGRRTLDQLAAAPLQRSGAYREAVARLEAFLADRLARRVAALAKRLDALQRTESGLAAPANDAGDGPDLDTVPAALLPDAGAAAAGRPRGARAGAMAGGPSAVAASEQAGERTGERASEEAARRAAVAWAEGLVPGQWLRLLLDGAWVHAQLLWLGDRRQILLLGDAASRTTWAVRRALLLKMHRHGLAKTLRMRSLVGTAALRVQEQLAIAAAA